MKTEKPTEYCQQCGQQIKGELRHLLRVCVNCNKLKKVTPLTLNKFSNTMKGWA